MFVAKKKKGKERKSVDKYDNTVIALINPGALLKKIKWRKIIEIIKNK
jgi:hypothetical protein